MRIVTPAEAVAGSRPHHRHGARRGRAVRPSASAEALIAIADPAFRDELTAAAGRFGDS